MDHLAPHDPDVDPRDQGHHVHDLALHLLTQTKEKEKVMSDDFQNFKPLLIILGEDDIEDQEENQEGDKLDPDWDPEPCVDDYPHWEDEIPEHIEDEEPWQRKLMLTHHMVSKLHLSGSTLEIGTLMDNMEEAIFFRCDDQREPIYIGEKEAELLISALQVAIDNIKVLK